MASSTVRAVSGLAIMSSTHFSKEKVVAEVPAGAATAMEAAMARTTRGRVNLTILAVVLGNLVSEA